MELSGASITLLVSALILLIVGATIAGITTEQFQARKSLLGPMTMASSLLVAGIALLVANELTLLAIVAGAILVVVGGALALRFGFAYASNEY